MLLLCISGHCFKIFRRSSRAHTINAFMGRLIWFGERGWLRRVLGHPALGVFRWPFSRIVPLEPLCGVLCPDESGEWLEKAESKNFKVTNKF